MILDRRKLRIITIVVAVLMVVSMIAFLIIPLLALR